MTIHEFLVAQHAITNGQPLPADIQDSPDFTAARESKYARDLMLVMANEALKPCQCAECKALPDGHAKTIAGIAVMIETAFLFGIRCGRVVPE